MFEATFLSSINYNLLQPPPTNNNPHKGDPVSPDGLQLDSATLTASTE
jgi:hypothetical protein